MNSIATLLTSLDVSILFAVAYAIAKAVATFLTPVLLVVSISIRMLETQAGVLVGSGKFGTAVRDIALWTFVLGAYFMLGNLLIDFFNPIYAWVDRYGSLNQTTAVLEALMKQNKIDSAADGLSITNILASPLVLFAMFFYYATLILLAFLTVFLKLANVMAFGLAFIWGLVAIPLSISQTFKILRGWALLLAFSLAWPFVLGLCMMMFSLLFENAAHSLMQMPESSTTLRAVNLYLLFAVLHLVLVAVLVAAPLIANSLVANAPSGVGVVMPFAGAAMAAAASFASRSPGGRSSGGLSTAGVVPPAERGQGLGISPQTPRPSPNANSLKQAKTSFANEGTNGGGTSTASTAMSTMASDNLDAPAVSGGAQPQAGRSQRQARRGAILNNKKRG